MEVIGGQNRIEAAKRLIAAMDATDAKLGRGVVPLSEQLGNVAAAINAGLEGKRWDCVAEALVMLSQCNDPNKVRPDVRFNSYVG